MKRTILLAVCVCLLASGIFIFGSGEKAPGTAAPEPVSDTGSAETETLPEPPPASWRSVSVPEDLTRTVQTMDTYADLRFIYTDYQSLIADSEIVVFGTVKELNAYAANGPVPINTDVVLSVETVFKGKVEADTVRYTVYGGRMPAIDWYQANAEKIKGKITSEVFEKELAAMESADMVEAFYMEVENVKAGDRVLVFLMHDLFSDSLVINGSSVSGQFFLDEASDTFFRMSDGEKSMIAGYAEITKLAETTPDNSGAVVEEAERVREEMENQTADESGGIIIEKDPAFDQFKGN